MNYIKFMDYKRRQRYKRSGVSEVHVEASIPGIEFFFLCKIRSSVAMDSKSKIFK